MNYIRSGTFKSGTATNVDQGVSASVAGLDASLVTYTGTEADSALNGTDRSEVFAYYLKVGSNAGYRFDGVLEFNAGGGNDLIDLTNSANPYPHDVTIDGGTGNDTIWSGPGDDELIGGADSDSIWGGAGSDTIFVHEDTFDDDVNGGPGHDVLTLTADWIDGQELYLDAWSPSYSIEEISFEDYGGYLFPINFSAPHVFDFSATAFTWIEQIDGGNAADVIVGPSSFTQDFAGSYFSIEANGGNDTVSAGAAGNYYIDGGAGADVVSGGSGNDELYGNAYNYLGHDSNTIDGGAGNDGIEGTYGSEVLAGGTGNDEIAGYGGNDVIDGGDGNDTLQGSGGTKTISGGAGDDRIVSGGGPSVDGPQTITGDSGNDTVFAGYGDDIIDGGAGNDRLNGSFGNDTLDGGSGDDWLVGNNGSDVYIFSPGVDTIDDAATDGTDRVLFIGLSAAQVNITPSGTTLILENGGNSVTILNQNTSQRVEFADFDTNSDGIVDQTVDLTLL